MPPWHLSLSLRFLLNALLAGRHLLELLSTPTEGKSSCSLARPSPAQPRWRGSDQGAGPADQGWKQSQGLRPTGQARTMVLL